MLKQIGLVLVAGVVPQQPLFGFPVGKKRIRMREKKHVRVYVRPPAGGIRVFAVREWAGGWMPAIELGSNTKG